jgi:hypothetical protein
MCVKGTGGMRNCSVINMAIHTLEKAPLEEINIESSYIAVAWEGNFN